jgi:hypothetical protein
MGLHCEQVNLAMNGLHTDAAIDDTLPSSFNFKSTPPVNKLYLQTWNIL